MINDDLFNVLKGEDNLGVVIRTHIHIESVLNSFFERLFINAEYIEKSRLNYHQKVKLAIACGLDSRFEKPLNKLGTMRNNFAHRLETQLGKNEVDSLYQSFEGDHKRIMQEAYTKTKKQFKTKLARSMSKLNPDDKFTLIAVCLHSVIKQETDRIADENTPIGGDTSVE